MKLDRTRIAATEYAKGNYAEALEIYRELGNLIGAKYYAVNVLLCEKRLSAQGVGKDGLNRSALTVQGVELKANMVLELGQIAIDRSAPDLEIRAFATLASADEKHEGKSRKLVLLMDFLDVNGTPIKDVPKITVSTVYGRYFRYIDLSPASSSDTLREVVSLTPPGATANIKLALATLGFGEQDLTMVRLQAMCINQRRSKAFKDARMHLQILPKPIIHDPDKKLLSSDLVVASILDEFTAECLDHEVTLIELLQEKWMEQLDYCRPHFLLVESCWNGNDGNWGTLTKGSSGGKKLGPLLAYCAKKGIPRVFWNKEDPPHYEKFAPIAALFDLVITSDVNMVPRYKAEFGIDAHPLSFAAQPRIHNPRTSESRLQKAVFAGSYYRDKPQRCADFDEVMAQIEATEVACDIFDRNFGKNLDKFKFPKRYAGKVVGNLSTKEMWRAYKGYKYQVNMNTVQNSSTMFARRIYESLASGTPVISNYSVGVHEIFGETVLLAGRDSIRDRLYQLESSKQHYEELARKGVRMVMREHTYAHRLSEICKLLGFALEVRGPKGTLICSVKNEADIQSALHEFAKQTLRNKYLFIELDNFDTAYKYLSRSEARITYAMNFANEWYSDEADFFNCKHFLKWDLAADLATEALEDFVYWGESSR